MENFKLKTLVMQINTLKKENQKLKEIIEKSNTNVFITNQTNITPSADYEIKEITRKSLIKQSEKLIGTRFKSEFKDYMKDVLTYLRNSNDTKI